MPDEKMHGDRLTKRDAGRTARTVPEHGAARSSLSAAERDAPAAAERDAPAAAERDAAFMGEALELAETGRGRTHPNPRVGALLVRDGVVVGRGAHLGPGTPHAEAAALAEAGGTARGATLYCTLEPCDHFGVTPPCADAIVAAGVVRAVVAMRDPNPLVDGRGFEKLRCGGVSVTLLEGEPARRAARQNEPFVKYIETGLPLVTYKAAVSLDGKVAAAGGDARWISGTASRAAVHRLRAGSDAVMVGAGTVRRDDPELTVREAGGRDPARVVVSRGGELPPRAKVLAAAATPTIVLCDRPPAAAARVAQVDYVSTGGDLTAGLRELARRGLLDILCEGGPSLAAGLLAAGLLDRLLVFVAPLVIGRGAPDLLASAAVHSIAAAHRLTEVEWRTIGDDLVVEGRLAGDEAARQRDAAGRAHDEAAPQRDDAGRAHDTSASAATGGEV